MVPPNVNSGVTNTSPFVQNMPTTQDMQAWQMNMFKNNPLFSAYMPKTDATSASGAAVMSPSSMSNMINMFMIQMLMQTMAKATGVDPKTFFGGAAAADSGHGNKPEAESTIKPAQGSTDEAKPAGLSEDKKSYVVGDKPEKLSDIARKVFKIEDGKEPSKEQQDKMDTFMTNIVKHNGLKVQDGKKQSDLEIAKDTTLSFYPKKKAHAPAKPAETKPVTSEDKNLNAFGGSARVVSRGPNGHVIDIQNGENGQRVIEEYDKTQHTLLSRSVVGKDNTEYTEYSNGQPYPASDVKIETYPSNPGFVRQSCSLMNGSIKVIKGYKDGELVDVSYHDLKNDTIMTESQFNARLGRSSVDLGEGTTSAPPVRKTPPPAKTTPAQVASNNLSATDPITYSNQALAMGNVPVLQKK